MAFQSVPDCASAVFNYTSSNVSVINRLTFAKAGGYDQDAIDALATALDLWWAVRIKPLQGAHVTYVNTTVKGLADPIDLYSVKNDNTGPGTHSGNAMPNNVTWAIRFTTGAIGRSARGRYYVVGLTSSDITESTQSVTVSPANAWIDAFSNYLPPAVGAVGWQHVIVSRFTNNAERLTGVYRAVTGYGYFDTVLDSQRGRLP